MDEVLGSIESDCTIVFLHGGPGMDCSYFRPFLDLLATRNRLIFYRQMRQPPSGVSDLVEELSMKVSTISGPVVLLGHSWGGALALEFMKSSQLKDRIAALILISPIVDTSFEEYYQIRSKGRLTWDTKKPYKPTTIAHVPIFFNPPDWERSAAIYDRIDFCEKTFAQLYASYLSTFSLRETLSGLQIPVLNIFGTADARVPVEYASQIAQLNSKIQAVALEGVAHFCFIDCPDQVIATVDQFLAKKVNAPLTQKLT